MSTAEFSSTKRPSPAVEAEAAAWLARLYGPNRTPQVDKGFRRWLDMSAEHAQAFERATETWEKLALVRRRPLEQVADWERSGFRLSFGRAAFAAVAVAAVTVAATAFYYSQDNAIATEVGEQRTMTLEDGTRIALNTDTRLRVDFSKKIRRLELQRGEALFQIAPHADWPFVVAAGKSEIKALGTSFVVRRDEAGMAVTLVDGMISVRAAAADTAATHPQPSEQVMMPGQRLTLRNDQPPRLDRPELDKVRAWERGQVAFDSTPLVDAVAEMNRYSRVKLELENAEAVAVTISGMFSATESAEFAQAIARTYSLQVTTQPGKIVLRGEPLVPSIPGGR